MPYLPGLLKEEALQQALEAVQTTGDVQTQARAAVLTGLLPHLAESRQAETLQQALVAAETIEDVAAQARALARLLPYLPEPRRADVLQQAFAAVQAIEDTAERAEALVRLAPHLSTLLEDRLQEIVAEAAEHIDDRQAEGRSLIYYEGEPSLARALQALENLGVAEEMSPGFLVIVFFVFPFALPQSRLYQLWHETLHALAARSRSDLLSGLHTLSFIVGKLGEGKAATEIAHAIQNVGQWWP